MRCCSWPENKDKLAGLLIVVLAAIRAMTSVFTSLSEEGAPEVILADGTVVQSVGRGAGVLTAVDGCGGAVKVTLSEVLFVPFLNSWLISVAKLAAKGFVVISWKDDCHI